MQHAKATRLGTQLRAGKAGHAFEAEKETHGASTHRTLRHDTAVSANVPDWMQIKEVSQFRPGGAPTMQRLIGGGRVMMEPVKPITARIWGGE